MTEPQMLYPAIEPHRSGMLAVSDVHTIYWEESGNPKGKPAVFVHGGPGGGTDPKHRRFFDPSVYRIVLFDQRGCGRSKPFASLEDNTTWALVDDMEKLRTHLGIESWLVFGGSWGSTLALTYAQEHPERVSELVLRGIFLLRKWEIDWFYQEGASRMFPDAWEDYLAPIPVEERGNMLEAYHKRLHDPDPAVALRAAKAWSIWEARTSCLYQDPSVVARMGGDEFATAFARIECHYFINQGFFEKDTQLIDNIAKIRHIPGVIVQGRYDVVCPAESAWDLKRAWPEAELVITKDAGHAAFEHSNLVELVKATDKFRPR